MYTDQFNTSCFAKNKAGQSKWTPFNMFTSCHLTIIYAFLAETTSTRFQEENVIIQKGNWNHFKQDILKTHKCSLSIQYNIADI